MVQQPASADGRQRPSTGGDTQRPEAIRAVGCPSRRLVAEGTVLRAVSAEDSANSNITLFLNWLSAERGIHLPNYDALWHWSVTERDDFWSTLWDFFNVQASSPWHAVCEGEAMRDTLWFPGARLNFSQHMLQMEAELTDRTLLHCYSEARLRRDWNWGEVGNAVRSVATGLRALGVKSGDRVAAYMPNIAETAIAMLAVTAIGAIWSCCSPEFGAPAVVDRFAQIEPKVLFAVNGYHFNGIEHDRRALVREIADRLPSVEHLIMLPALGAGNPADADPRLRDWAALIATPAPARAEFHFEQVESNDPLWILFTSGTTGLPKPIVHSHGGMLLGAFKDNFFHAEITRQSTIFFYSTTSWVIWNTTICAMLLGAKIAIYDGSPFHPDLGRLWAIAAETNATVIGASPTYVNKLIAQGYRPRDCHALDALELLIMGGAPASPELFDWLTDALPPRTRITSQSGSTELCGAYAGGVRTIPTRAGEISARALGMDVEALGPDGAPVREAAGELVIRSPFPNMPIGLWNDPQRCRFEATYFATIPGVWRQGDLLRITDEGGCYVLGRSDATIKRNGIRIGTGEIYRALDTVDAVADAIALYPQSGPHKELLVLFVQLAPGAGLNAGLRMRITETLTRRASRRHVPDLIVEAPFIPYTATGKRMEVPLRLLLEGAEVQDLFQPSSMAEPAAARWYAAYAQALPCMGTPRLTTP